MKKTRLFITSFLIVSMLSACSTLVENSVDQNIITENTENVNANNTTNENTSEQQSSENTSMFPQNSSNNSSPSTDSSNEEQQPTLSYTIGQQTFEKQFERVYSAQQDFSIQLTDQFFLMEEEPGMDVVFYKENEAIMMRVEVLSKNDWTYENALEKSTSIIMASSKDNSYSSYNLPSNINTKSFIQYDGFLVENESDKVLLLLMDLDDKIIRLTIFDDYITNVSEAFFVQGATIQ